LGAISGNRFKNCELSPFQRGIIIGKHSTGLTAFKIAKELKLDPALLDILSQKTQNDTIDAPKVVMAGLGNIPMLKNVLSFVIYASTLRTLIQRSSGPAGSNLRPLP
jgi:hypothetical protein